MQWLLIKINVTNFSIHSRNKRKGKELCVYQTWIDHKPSEPTKNQPEATMNRPGKHQESIRITWFWLFPGGFLVNSRKMTRMILAFFTSFYKTWNDQKRPRTYQEPTTKQPKPIRTHQESTKFAWFWLIPDRLLAGSERFTFYRLWRNCC